mmetsp:Transcript_18185/g.52992  ORF Transcript_18185/g.52992 Transcript_18185/m.52992 type:complete len:115 (-) Transcript_18185:136-480(-)
MGEKPPEPHRDASRPLSLEDVRASAAGGDPRATRAMADIERIAPENRQKFVCNMLHRMATAQGRDQYVDPASGFTVFTASFLKKRACCGYNCRHCPHGHMNVPATQEKAVAEDW